MKIINFLRYRFRKFLLEEITLEDYIERGMKIGKNCSIMDGWTFDYGHCNLITIGDNVTIAPQAYLLAHDASTKRDLGYTKIGQVVIEDNVFIGARALIMPNVTVGRNSIVGAGSVVTKDVPPNSVVSGNPARIICSKADYIEKNKKLMENVRIFNTDYKLDSIDFDEDKNKEIKKETKNKIAFLE